MSDVRHFIKHHWVSLAFVCGFITDLILLNGVDDLFDNLILLGHVLISTTTLFTLYAALSGKFGERLSKPIERISTILMQYSFGGLFSGMLIFYGQSGDITASWPFFVFIVGAIAGNELIKQRGRRLVFNILAYFIGLFSYVVLVVPVFTGFIGPWAFILSGLAALSIVYLVVALLRKLIPYYIYLHTRQIVFLVTGTYAMLVGLYFMNVIPPIPLSIEEIAIAHEVVRQGSDYRVTREPIAWYDVRQLFRPTIHPTTGKVACYANVYAPLKIKTTIIHEWSYYNEVRGKWEARDRISYPISGAAASGYRGYTEKSNLENGLWRCSVENERGQPLGHQTFYVDRSGKPAKLEVVIR